MNQAAIDGIRAAGATTQYIAVEGNSYSGAWTWTSVNTNLANLTDSANKLLYEMHQYLDSDGSGTSETCVSSTIGVERVTAATEWLIANGKVGILGEFAGGANSVCQQALTGMLDYMEENSNVWLGALWWAGGPWWGTFSLFFFPFLFLSMGSLAWQCHPRPSFLIDTRSSIYIYLRNANITTLRRQVTTFTLLSLHREPLMSTTTPCWRSILLDKMMITMDRYSLYLWFGR